MQEQDIQDAEEAINNLAEAFSALESAVKSLPANKRNRYFNPEVFGPISVFLQIGHGYEAAHHSSQFHNSDDLLADMQDEMEDETDDSDEEDFPDERHESDTNMY